MDNKTVSVSESSIFHFGRVLTQLCASKCYADWLANSETEVLSMMLFVSGYQSAVMSSTDIREQGWNAVVKHECLATLYSFLLLFTVRGSVIAYR